MIKPTGKLAMAYATIAKMEARIKELEAGQPATAKVVLPERMDLRSSDGSETYETKACNACIDATAKLNGVTPMSNETIAVSREQLEKALKADASQGASAIELHEGWLAMKVLRAALAQPAAPVTTQEPIGYISQSAVDMLNNGDHVPATICSATKSRTNRHSGPDASWQVPVYTHADPAEVRAAIETLQKMGYTFNGGQLWKPPIGKKPDFDLIDTLRAQLADEQNKRMWAEHDLLDTKEQLAERDALLKRQPSFIRALEQFEADDGTFVRLHDVLDALSASAEPSAPVLVNGRYRFDEVKCSMVGDPSGDWTYSGEPSAPVERDERAEFEKAWCEDPSGPQVDPMWMLRSTINPENYAILSVQSDWESWQARAKLNGGAQ